MKLRHLALALFLPLLPAAAPAAKPADPGTAEIQNPAISGGVTDGKVRLIIEGLLANQPGGKTKLLFGTTLQHTITASRDKLSHRLDLTLNILQGDPQELTLTIGGEGDIKQITGDNLQDWSVRQEPNGTRTLLLRPKKADKPQLSVSVLAESELKDAKSPLPSFTLTPPQPLLFSGFVKIESSAELDIQVDGPTGLFPIEAKFLPATLQPDQPPRPIPAEPGAAPAPPATVVPPAAPAPTEPEPLAFQFHSSGYTLPLRLAVADPEMRRVSLHNFKLTGTVAEQNASFVLSATARVLNPKGGSLKILGGGLALSELPKHPDWHMSAERGDFVLTFDKPGDYPLTLKFNAAVDQVGAWSTVDFRVAPSSLQPFVLLGLGADTELQFNAAARPERSGTQFASFLPADGTVRFAWKTAVAKTEGKLFYAAEMLSQISVGPGLMRQVALIEGKIMQGELEHLTLLLRGEGAVTRVIGEQVVSWKVEPGANASERRLIVQFNQPQKNQFAIQLQTQTPMDALPQTVNALQIQPEAATRFAGYIRVVNQGAVRLEVLQAKALSQISPEQFPESDATRSVLRATGEQRFAYRFSGADFSLRIQADQILPELSVSQVLAYHLGENETSIDADIELDVREAPLRELLIRVPRGYTVAKLTAAKLSDYFVRDLPDSADAELRLVYTQPVSGRQVLQLRLELNKPLGATSWTLPRIEVAKAKSVRGHVAVAADPGFRLSTERSQGFSEIATAYFPRKIANIQTAFRISEPTWQATLRVERLPQSIQADAFHLFSIGEGVAYGSSVLNYNVSGAPIAAFKVELSAEYFNVEFTGKDVRNWQKTDSGYLIQLHTPVSGPYTLLATYERPFKPQGETLAFTGARPLDSQSEQGYTLIISAYQFQVKPADVSAGLLRLEPGEVPAEYRLFFDAPVLAAYRYVARPFNLKLALSPLAQGDSLSQVTDRALLNTRISKEGNVITDAQYFVKSRGNAHFSVTAAAAAELWSVTVNGVPVVPVKDGLANLIPLPQRQDPNAVLHVQLKLAERSADPARIKISSPLVGTPVLLTEWVLEGDAAQRLSYRSGSLTPVGGEVDNSGFAALARLWRSNDATTTLLVMLGLLAASMLAWRSSMRDGIHKYSARHLAGLTLGCVTFALAVTAFCALYDEAQCGAIDLPSSLSFVAPVQQAGQALALDIGNAADELTVWNRLGYAWPALFALLLWAYAWIAEKPAASIAGWTMLAWAALRWPNGTDLFFTVIAVFILLKVLPPNIRRFRQMPRKPGNSGNAAMPAAAAILLLSFAAFSQAASPVMATPVPAAAAAKNAPVAETVTQQIRVDDQFAVATAKVHWQALKGQQLPLFFEPAVLTKIDYPIAALKLVKSTVDNRSAQVLLALADGAYDIEFQYQISATGREGETGLVLPTQFGLVNSLTLTLANLDVDVLSPQAVAIVRNNADKNTVAKLVLTPTNNAWISWKPRSRNLAQEKPVFYAEFTQLYTPTAGVIEGLHAVSIRPAQGELSELVFTIPKGTTITNALDPASLAGTPADRSTVVQQWRFDPDSGKLRVNLAPAQSRPFAILLRSQTATGPLPVTQNVGLIGLDGAATQIGVLGVATGNEVQLDTVAADKLTPINLEDFPGNLAPLLAAQIPGITVRRALRYADVKSTASIKASPVEPDVRVESQDTLSLGEDRAVLAVNTSVDITRAGIFRLSFALPAAMDIESITGEALSHWTESKVDGARVITMHLRGRTEGTQKFDISLAGPGLKSAKALSAPQLIIREASKQRGTYLVVPEQGMRLQVATRDGISQLDPQKSGINQKGVLAFRVLQTPWKLVLDIEQVDAWVQVNSLQHATVGEAQVKTVANLQYQIENTGLKVLRVALPADAENVKFRGEHVADFLPLADTLSGGLQTWEIKLHQHVIGQYQLQASYLTPVPDKGAELTLLGVQVADVNLQRGFVSVLAGGRLRLRVDATPAALQATEWQSIPQSLQKDLSSASANFAYRLVEPAFKLVMKLERHEATKLLPARITKVSFASVLSDNGSMLTQVRLDIIPGDKRLLHLTLPKDAKFWFAFVNQNGVWPWREGDQILIPLEQQARNDQPIPVALFFSNQIQTPGSSALDLQLQAPKFDLPLENITWKIFLNEKWQLKKWSGSLQRTSDELVSRSNGFDPASYMQGEASQMDQKIKAAEEMFARGNSALAQGDPQQARRAFESAFDPNQHNNGFNEDARVKLHNVKLQQALVGLSVRKNTVSGAPDPLSGKLHTGPGKEAKYTQQDAKDLMGRNTPDENNAFSRLAERLIQQQDAAVSSPSAIQATLPEQGRLLTFSRTVAVDHWADLHIGLEAKADTAGGWLSRLLVLLGTALGLALLAVLARKAAPAN